MIRLLVDEHIPCANSFERIGEVKRTAGRAINRDALKNIDALIVRSVTPVNESLLAATPVRFVGSATSGVDHVDEQYLRRNGIKFVSAPGSNAESVVDYVLAALATLLPELAEWRKRSFGIIGCGQVGSRLLARLRGLGMACRVCDPFLPDHALAELCSLAEALDCDVISLHTPLTFTGPHPTHHMLTGRRLGVLRDNAILINTARGGVIDSQDLICVLNERDDLRSVLDVFEEEPRPDPRLIRLATLGTPHIAGYAWDGKRRATEVVYRACCAHFGLAPAKGLQSKTPPSIDVHGEDNALAVVRRSYDIAAEAREFREEFLQDEDGSSFDRRRNHYPIRREFSAVRVRSAQDVAPELETQLSALGFSVQNRY